MPSNHRAKRHSRRRRSHTTGKWRKLASLSYKYCVPEVLEVRVPAGAFLPFFPGLLGSELPTYQSKTAHRLADEEDKLVVGLANWHGFRPRQIVPDMTVSLARPRFVERMEKLGRA